MPTQSSTVDKFQLVQILSTIIKELEDDRIKYCKISFNQTKTGIYNTSVFYNDGDGKQIK